MPVRFDETQHPRSGDGKFKIKGLSESALGVDADLDVAPLAPRDEPQPWEQVHPALQAVLLSAADLQQAVHGAVLVGGSVAAFYAGHRASYDHDHVLVDLAERYDEVRSTMEQMPGWDESTRATKPPMTVMGELGDIEAGVRQLRRSVPLETTQVLLPGGRELTIPTLAEALRIKAYLAVQRNQVRDHLDIAALSDWIGTDSAADILLASGHYYPQEKDLPTRIALSLADPMPKDARTASRLSGYKGLAPHWQDWKNVQRTCMDVAREMTRRSL